MTKTEKILSVYCKLGYHIFPVKRETKRPAIKDNLNLASTDMDQIKEWSKVFPDCFWGMSLAKSGLVAVDVDWKHGGMEAWDGLIKAKGDPETLRATTGSGGLHYVFMASPGQRYRGQIQKGIDVKHNGYILIYPSKNARTQKLYKWDNWKEFGNKIQDPPEWLFDMIKKDSRVGKASPVYRFGNDYLKRLVDELKRFELSYHEWVNAGMAIHAADDSTEGLALFLDLTQGESFEDGDIEKAEEKWESFSHREDGISQMSLGWLVREKGGIVPNPHYQDDIEAFKRNKIEALEKAIEDKKDKGFHFDAKLDCMICYSKKELLAHFDKIGYSMIKDGSMQPFLQRVKDGNEFHLRKMPERAAMYQVKEYNFGQIMQSGDDVDLKIRPAFDVWLESASKRTYKKIVFKAQSENPDELNLWTPIDFEADFKASCDDILRLIRESLCNNDEQKSEWLLDWLAHLIQMPQEKSTIVPVLVSKQGAGKGILFDHVMAPILGYRYTSVQNMREITNNFNERLSKKFLTFIDEATWSGNKKDDGVLKRLIGSPTMTVEEKFQGAYTMDNYSRYAIASNNAEAVAMEVGNRRYVYIRANDDLANDLSFFGPIGDKIRKNKETRIINAFYAHLLARDLSEFNPFKILENNNDGGAAKIKTAGIVAQFWEDVFFEEPLQIWDDRGLNMSLAFEEFCAYSNRIRAFERDITSAGFWRKTREMVKGLPDRKQKRIPGSAKTSRYLNISPLEMAKSFSNTVQINFSEDFDESGFYLFSDETSDLAAW